MPSLSWFRAPKWIWITAASLALLLVAYAIIGFKVAPSLIRKQAIAYVKETYGRELQIGAVRVQPFKLQLEIKDIAFPDNDRAAMLSLRRLFVDFDVSSLWRRAFVFSEVALESPGVRAVLRRNGSMNLADLSPPATTPPPPAEEKSDLPSIWIESLDVTDGKVNYVDLARRQAFERSFAPVVFSLQDFRTTPEGGDFHLTASSSLGEQFDWNGQFALAPTVSSHGDFTIAHLEAPGVAEFLGDALPFGITTGKIDLNGSYTMSLGTTTELNVKLPSIALSALNLRAQGTDADWIQVPSVLISDTAVALPQQDVAIAKIAVTGLKAQGWLNPDGSINLTQLFAAPAAVVETATAPAVPDTTATKSTATAIPTAPAVADKPWNVEVAAVDVLDASLDFEDRAKAPVKKFAITPINVHVRDASLDLARPLPVAVEATINGQVLFKADGSLTPDPLAADLDISLDKARMTFLQPYVLPLADLTIQAGTLTMAGKLLMKPPADAGPEISFSGNAAIDGFKSVDNSLHQDLINFRRLQFQKLRYEMAPDALHIDRVVVTNPYARVIISREEILNISAVLDPKGAAAQIKARKQQEAMLASESKTDKRKREAVAREAARAAEKADKARKKTGKPVVRQPTAAPPPETTPIRIREVRIDGGRMNFSDYSVQPNFSAEVMDLKGSVTGLSTAFTSRAKVDLKGNVGEFSPVTIGGTLQPFAFDRYTDIGLDFENISLPLFNPYSGRFAGYSISKGKLTTKFHYLIEDRKLTAAHHIRIDQLEWGEASGVKGEATLPVKFATALLRDKDGVIDLDIPVTGTLDDPKLRIGPIVWKIIKNLIVKAVTAPFALLGSLFKGAEEAQFVDFAPGDATLDAATAERLATLSKGLVEKNGINLDVPIGMSAELDRPGLVEHRYRQQLSDAIAANTRRREGDETPLPAFAALTPKQRVDLLEGILKQSGGVPKIPELPAPPEGTSRADTKAAEEAAALEFLEKEARSRIVIADTDLDTLAQERASSVQRALLSAGSALEPSRVFLTKDGKVSTHDGKVRFELGLK